MNNHLYSESGNRSCPGVNRELAGITDSYGGLYAYELQALLPQELLQQFGEEQSFARERFGKEAFSPAAAGITVARFHAREEMESTLLRWLNRVVGQQESFPVLFNNYSSMPGFPLYLRVQDPVPFRLLAESFRVIDGWLKGNDCPSLTLCHHPRLALAERLDQGKALEILLEFSGRCFRAEMELEELVLVRRAAGEEDHRVISRLKLLPRGLRAGRGE